MVSEKQSFDSGTFVASLLPLALKGEVFILLEGPIVIVMCDFYK